MALSQFKALVSSILPIFLIINLVAAAAPSTYSQSFCVTRNTDRRLNAVPTRSVSDTASFTRVVTVTATPTTTVNPLQTTITATTTRFTTSTLTLVPTTTDSYTTTVISTSTSRLTGSTTTTVFTTVTGFTTVTLTSTASASAAFTPLGSAIAAGGNTYSKRRRTVKAAAALEARAPARYPAAVTCYRFVEIVATSTRTVQGQATSTVNGPRNTATVVSTSVITLTSTKNPPQASTTITATSTVTAFTTTYLTSTSSVTLSTTSTVFAAAAATYYPTCQQNNLVSAVNGNPIDTITPYNSDVTSTAVSAYDCCVQCDQNPTCGSSAYGVDADGSTTCIQFLENNNVCAGGTAVGSFTSNPTGTAGLFTLSNSNCGQLSSGTG